MIVEPVKRGVGVHQIGWLVGAPVSEIRALPCDVRDCLGFNQHVWRGVNSGNGGERPPLAQHPCNVAGPTAEIVDGARLHRRDACEEVERRPHPMVSESEIEMWVPCVRYGASFPFSVVFMFNLNVWAG